MTRCERIFHVRNDFLFDGTGVIHSDMLRDKSTTTRTEISKQPAEDFVFFYLFSSKAEGGGEEGTGKEEKKEEEERALQLASRNSQKEESSQAST